MKTGREGEGDPKNENLVLLDTMPRRPKKELIDKLPSFLPIDVQTQNGFQAIVNVVPSWQESGVLQIELTSENMDFLLEASPDESAKTFLNP